MGAVPSTPRRTKRPWDAAEHGIGAFVGDKSYPMSSEFWPKLLELPLTLQWPQHRVAQACQIFSQNNYQTRHLAKILIHMAWCLQECMMTSSGSSVNYTKAVNATYISSVFLKFIIENSKSDTFEELYLSLNEAEAGDILPPGERIESYVIRVVLNFIGTSDANPHSSLLHHELLNFMLVAVSTQLRSGPSPGPKDVHPFIDAAMVQEGTVVTSVVRRLLLNFITRPRIPFSGTGYPVYSDGNQPGVLQRVGSAAANFVLLPYYTFNYLVSSSGDGSKSPLADISLLVLLILIHYRKCVNVDESTANNGLEDVDSHAYSKENSYFCDNPYCKALENARDIEFDRVDIEGNAQNGPLVRLPFASLFDTLGLCLAEESSVLLLYSLVHGNSDFLEYVLVRTDLDTPLLPLLETLYNASRRTSNQIYMVLIILLILSQDSSFNASIHKLILLNVPWYQERLLHHTSLGSLMVVILIRTVKYNLSKLRDVYLHTNCLAVLANMAPHVHRLSAYASQRLVSLFDMLSRKYTKLAEWKNDKVLKVTSEQIDGDSISEDMSTELHIYTDFLRIVLEILNAIITYALPRNPEVLYALMHRQDVFLPFKNHPRFNELLENIFTVLDFFYSRMDMQRTSGGWSVDEVLQVIIMNCRSWHREGMNVILLFMSIESKMLVMLESTFDMISMSDDSNFHLTNLAWQMFTQLRFTYEQESHPEEFFIPYVWRLVLAHSFTFNPDAINLFPIDLPVDDISSSELAVYVRDHEHEH